MANPTASFALLLAESYIEAALDLGFITAAGAKTCLEAVHSADYELPDMPAELRDPIPVVLARDPEVVAQSLLKTLPGITFQQALDLLGEIRRGYRERGYREGVKHDRECGRNSVH